jgi:hypothetical protein
MLTPEAKLPHPTPSMADYWRAQLASPNAAHFANYFAGAVAGLVDVETWHEALRVAAECELAAEYKPGRPA